MWSAIPLSKFWRYVALAPMWSRPLVIVFLKNKCPYSNQWTFGPMNLRNNGTTPSTPWKCYLSNNNNYIFHVIYLCFTTCRLHTSWFLKPRSLLAEYLFRLFTIEINSAIANNLKPIGLMKMQCVTIYPSIYEWVSVYMKIHHDRFWTLYRHFANVAR